MVDRPIGRRRLREVCRQGAAGRSTSASQRDTSGPGYRPAHQFSKPRWQAVVTVASRQFFARFDPARSIEPVTLVDIASNVRCLLTASVVQIPARRQLAEISRATTSISYFGQPIRQVSRSGVGCGHGLARVRRDTRPLHAHWRRHDLRRNGLDRLAGVTQPQPLRLAIGRPVLS